MITVYEDGYVDVDLVTEVERACGRDAVDYALIDWKTDRLGEVHEADRGRVGT